MNISNPYRKALLQTISALTNMPFALPELQAKMNEFLSSGRGKLKSKPFTKSYANMRKSTPSKYTPHQSKKECARRVKQATDSVGVVMFNNYEHGEQYYSPFVNYYIPKRVNLI